MSGAEVWRAELDPHLDREYDNRAMTPEHPEITARWLRESEAFRAETPGARDIAYGSGARQAIDQFLPTAPSASAALMFIHGGYWAARDRKDFSVMLRGVVAHGVEAYAPSYTLCPDCEIADIIDEMREAVRHVAQVSGKPVVVAGHSAGGHLAAALLASDWSAQGAEPVVLAAVSISGLFDLTRLLRTQVNRATRMTEQSAAAASPINMAPPSGLTLDLVVGGAESPEYHRQSAGLAQKWARAGVAVRYESLPGANHFTALEPMADPDSALTRRLAALCGAEPAFR